MNAPIQSTKRGWCIRTVGEDFEPRGFLMSSVPIAFAWLVKRGMHVAQT